jgi:hypothetical protein
MTGEEATANPGKTLSLNSFRRSEGNKKLGSAMRAANRVSGYRLQHVDAVLQQCC